MIIYNRDSFDNVIRSFSGEKEIFIAGAGDFGCEIGMYFDWLGVDWKGYIDKEKKGVLNEKLIINYDSLNNYAIFIISSVTWREDIRKELLSRHVPEENIIEFVSNDLMYELLNVRLDIDSYTNKLKKFKNIYRGKRCFVIGNGPSLKIEDLEKIIGEISFAVNSIFALYPQTTWRPTFYVTKDTAFGNTVFNKKEQIWKIIEPCQAAFTSVWSKAFTFRNDSDLDKLYFFKTVQGTDNENLPLFSQDISRQIYLTGSVIYSIIQLAAYMGFDEIYLLGVDNQYSYEKKNNGEIVHNDVEDYSEHLRSFMNQFNNQMPDIYLQATTENSNFGYKAARKYANNHGIKIFNATRGGKLEIFERVDFDSLF